MSLTKSYIDEKMKTLLPDCWFELNQMIEDRKAKTGEQYYRDSITFKGYFIGSKGYFSESYNYTVPNGKWVNELMKERFGFNERDIHNAWYRLDLIELSANPNKTKKIDKEFYNWLNDNFFKPMKDFTETCNHLRSTINSCNTDKQLADMYPEFVQYFNHCGITVKSSRQVPVVYGLPDKLKEFGWKGDETNPNKDLVETIKEDIEDDNK